MRHAMGSLAAAAVAAGMLAWLAGPLHANGPVQTNGQFVNDPNVRLFTPTPRIRDTDEPETTAPTPVVVNVVVDARALDRAYHAGLLGDVRKDRIRRPIGHSRGLRAKRSFAASRGFRADWSSLGFRADWSFGTGRGFHAGRSLRSSRGFHAGKSLRSSRGFSARKSLRSGRGFSAGRSFSTGRAGFGGGRVRR